MFKSNRYLIFSTAIGIVSIVCLMILYRQIALASLVDSETRSNVALTEVMSNAIWSRYRNLIITDVASINEIGEIHPAIVQLDYDVKQLMRGSTKLVKVKIYNLDGSTFYSSDPSQVNQDKRDNPGFLSARSGKIASNVTFRHEFDSFDGKQSDVNVVSSYIPIRNRLNGEPEAVFEVYSNVTDLIRQMQRLQWQIVIGVLGSMAIFYALLITNSRRVDRIESAHQEEASRSEAQILYQTYYDQVTELPNRLSFKEKLDQTISSARGHGTRMAVILMDIDRFKLVNDSFGDGAGDTLLRLITLRLSNSMRQSDMLFHMGGDEFTVLLENIDSSLSVSRLAKRMVESMKAPFYINGHSIVTTLSFGISIQDEDDIEPAKLVKNAEAAMYLAKERGGNQIQFYALELNENAQAQLAFESALQQALGNDEFVLHYQRRLAADEETVVGFEALIRWLRPDGQLASPAEFIPILEKIGLIHDVGRWVLFEACSQCKAWSDAGYDPLRISVNVSPRQFRDNEFVDLIRNVLTQTRLSAKYLELELTESALLDNPDKAIETMEELRAMGVTLTMDDFGTGYSSFSYLKNLPVDFLKIDRSFVREIEQNTKDAAIISAIASVAINLDIGLVAEGVEKYGQAKKLIQAGCQELQGFLYSKPVSANEAEKWLPTKRPIDSVIQIRQS